MSDDNVNPRMTKSNVIYVVVFSIALNKCRTHKFVVDLYQHSIRDETGAT